jgi:hypothetical protein
MPSDFAVNAEPVCMSRHGTHRRQYHRRAGPRRCLIKISGPQP